MIKTYLVARWCQGLLQIIAVAVALEQPLSGDRLVRRLFDARLLPLQELSMFVGLLLLQLLKVLQVLLLPGEGFLH